MAMAEPRPFASLTSGLLARKGGARPAMRRPTFGSGPHGHGHDQDDLGWNDMGEDHAAPHSFAGLTPMPHAHEPLEPVPSPAIEQQQLIEQSFAPAPASVPAEEETVAVSTPAVAEEMAPVVQPLAAPVLNEPTEIEPVMAETVEVAPVAAPAAAPKARAPRKAAAPRTRRSKAAFTLRLDPERHLKLRLSCALAGRSAQQLVTEALDDFLKGQTQVEALVEQLPDGGQD